MFKTIRVLRGLNGIITQPIKLKKSVKLEPKINKNLFALLGITISLIINFRPSANGCKKPQIPTTFGPLRRCIAAIAFLSAKVKKAIAISNGTNVIKV